MTDTFDQTMLRQHPYRWRLSRAGFINVWHYYENTFDISGGRLILRGTNGSGKSRALEMLLPFLLDADRRNMGTGTPVRMEDLMSAGAGEQGNRLGYMWLELCRDPGPAGTEVPGLRYLTLGALVRFTVSTKEAKVWYFTTPLRVGFELSLLGQDRQPMSRRDLAERITDERITDVPEKHREHVRAEVFGLTGQLGKERFDGLTKLLHTLRSPDVGNRINEGHLPAILADALPPLSEDALTDAGQQLDGLTNTREDQQRLEKARDHVRTFLEAYRRYTTGVLASSLDGVRTSVRAVTEATQVAGTLAERLERLEADLTEKRLRVGELTEQATHLEAALTGLRESAEYQSVKELDRLSTLVASLATTADIALGAAAAMRRDENGRVAASTALADDVDHAATAVSAEIRQTREHLVAVGLTEHDLPAEVGVERRPGPASRDVVRSSRQGEPEELHRPGAEVLTLQPADLDGVVDAARRAEGAARTRLTQAGNRASEAKALTDERRKVDQAAALATSAETRAEEDASEARDMAEQRDTTAIALVDQWRAWIADPATTDLLDVADWSQHPILGLLLLDRTALCGDDTAVALQDLDRALDDAMDSAASALAIAMGHLDDADTLDQQRAGDLVAEQTRLTAEQDPDPEPPTWVTVTGGAPLWRCLDFDDRLGMDDRAGIEAALLASGLLTATVDRTGQLTAATGQLLLSPAGDRVPTPLNAALRVDPASPLPADAVLAVLERIGLDDRSTATWVGRDGAWGNGSLRGRHAVPAPRHIGAAARAAARAARLAEIDRELAVLDEAVRSRQVERQQIERRQRDLRDRRRAAPRSMELAQAQTRAGEAARRAGQSAIKAQRLRASADALARTWAEKDRAHRQACAGFGFPSDEDSLRRLQERADRAVAGCTTVARGVGALGKAIGRYGTAVEAIAELAEQRAEAESAAAKEWGTWYAEAIRLQTLTDAVGVAAAQVQHRITTTETALKQANDERETISNTTQKLNHELGTVSAEARAATSKVSDLRTVLNERVTIVLNQLSQPGVIETAFPADPGQVFTNLAAESIDNDAEALLGLLRRGRSDENALFRAQQSFEQAISGSYDVSATIAAGVRLFELIDAEGRRPLAKAATEIDRQCQIGRAALTEREHQVFSKFVLGEVGEELRRRLGQAGSLISAMNTSLKSIRTSHGISVRLTWKLAEDASGDIARIRELIATAAAVRTPAQDTELTELLSARVAAEALKEPTAGYALHLRAALDYREWHAVEVIITGPEEGRERRISRRAKLSQGETRFVSYVTLFVAVDAYLSGLENTAMSLRLILLDDAFAKVDEPTIAELLGLLVRLDVDFAMTGHALWGCVPQVPALDVYEICREDGSPAATAHVRWDGRNRHFLHAT
jgi:uncharacterized protein (TIGR02680 family)